jgi:hypothetical protein
LVVPWAPPAVDEGELSIASLLPGAVMDGVPGAVIGAAPVVPICPPERGWFGAPDCSAPEFIDPGLVLPGGGRFCADARETASRLAAPMRAILLIMIDPSIVENG